MSNWVVYLLMNEKGRSYVGSTTNVVRRLRQHNGELVGGARSTRGHKWRVVVFISNFSSRSEACRWERIVKCRARGVQDRKQALIGLAFNTCPPGRRAYDVPQQLKVEWHYP